MSEQVASPEDLMVFVGQDPETQELRWLEATEATSSQLLFGAHNTLNEALGTYESGCCVFCEREFFNSIRYVRSLQVLALPDTEAPPEDAIRIGTDFTVWEMIEKAHGLIDKAVRSYAQKPDSQETEAMLLVGLSFALSVWHNAEVAINRLALGGPAR